MIRQSKVFVDNNENAELEFNYFIIFNINIIICLITNFKLFTKIHSLEQHQH